MYTSLSEYVPSTYRTLMIETIRTLRPVVRKTVDQSKMDYVEGRRFFDDEQCFQAAMQIALHGDGWNYMSDADKAVLVVEKLSGWDITELAKAAILNAANCDYHYMFEKSFE